MEYDVAVPMGDRMAKQRKLAQRYTRSWHSVESYLTIGLDAVLEAVQLPARISDLDTGLADVD
jgi:hypothetical protein